MRRPAPLLREVCGLVRVSKRRARDRMALEAPFAAHGPALLGLLFDEAHALEQVKAEAAVAAFPQARAPMSRRRLRRWFDE